MRILAYTSPARGHLYPLVPILAELRADGHDVAVRTLAGEVAHLRGAGLLAEPIAAPIEAIAHDDYLARNPLAAVKRSTAVFVRRAADEPADLQRAIDAHEPDVLIVDANCWGASAQAEAWGGPWASFLPYPAPFPGKGVPPFGPGWAPAHGPLGRLRDRLLAPVLIGGVERAIRPGLNEVRGSVGVAPVASASDVYTRAPLTLYLSAEPFEYPRADWPASFRLVGPISYDPPAETPSWLADVTQPIVLVTTSSEFQDDGRLVATALDALRDEDVFVVATLPAGDPDRFDVPANARLERFVPHSPLLPHVACAVTHGGMGATQKALAAGVPVCAVPFGRDQNEVARRVQIAGGGSRLPAKRLSPERLRSAVRSAMDHRDGAAALARAFAEAGGAARAAREVVALMPQAAR